MSDSRIEGVWTYRSFKNDPTYQMSDEQKLNDLFWAEAELTFDGSTNPGNLVGQLAFRSKPKQHKTDARLELTGSTQGGSPMSVQFVAVGVHGTDADGWVYEYVGYFVPQWLAGVGQRSALVGTVIRAKPHDREPAGYVGSFIAVKRDFLEPREVIPLPPNVVKMLASRMHRLHHLVWHGVRNQWITLTANQRAQIQKLGWAPETDGKLRPALKTVDPGQAHTPYFDTGAGEDFLFMHRQMIDHVNAALANAKRGPLVSWKTIPAPRALTLEPDPTSVNPRFHPAGNPVGETVPPAWDEGDENDQRRSLSVKSDEYFWARLRWWDFQFKDPAYLSSLTLSELGAQIEWSIHGDLHRRWESETRNPSTGEHVPSGRDDGDIRTLWDNPVYDNLGDMYSSHVNPVFWRLHGWIDDRIEDWFKAHESAQRGEIKRTAVMGTPWFTSERWVKIAMPWAGPMNMKKAATTKEISDMERVVAILFPSNVPASAHLAKRHRKRRLTRF